MDNPAVEIWASLAKFKLKSLNLYFWLDWIPWYGMIFTFFGLHFDPVYAVFLAQWSKNAAIFLAGYSV